MAHDPTADEVAAAIATLQAFEAARETQVGGAVPVEPVMPSESPAVAADVSVDAPVQVFTDAPVQVFTDAPVQVFTDAPVQVSVDAPVAPPPAVDPYVARSVKSSPNGF